MKEVLRWSDDFARDSETGYIAGTDGLSLADLAFAATYSTIVGFNYFDLVSATAVIPLFYLDKLKKIFFFFSPTCESSQFGSICRAMKNLKISFIQTLV